MWQSRVGLWRVLLGMGLICGGGALPVSAATYDVANDFSATANPNGVWSCGYSTALGSAFILDSVGQLRGNIDQWAGGIADDGNPAVYHNGTGAPDSSFGVPFETNQVCEHPGPNGEYAIVRWTAPSSGVWTIDALFGAMDIGSRDVHVLCDGISLFDAGNPGPAPRE